MANRKPNASTRKIINHLEKGLTPKEIAKKMGIPVGRVYNARYYHNKRMETGISSLQTAPAKPKAKPKLEPNVMVDYEKIMEPAKPEKPSLWKRLLGVFGWR